MVGAPSLVKQVKERRLPFGNGGGNADEEALGASCITDRHSPAFFETEFWFMWATTFAFQP
jgi:hypothetical protein